MVVGEGWEAASAAELGTAEDGALLRLSRHVEVSAVGLTELGGGREEAGRRVRGRRGVGEREGREEGEREQGGG